MVKRAPSASAGGSNLSSPAPTADSSSSSSKKKRAARRWRGIKNPGKSILVERLASIFIAVIVFSSSLTPLYSPSPIILPGASASQDQVTPQNNEAAGPRKPLEPGTVTFRNTPPESTTGTVQEAEIYSNLKVDNESYTYSTHVGTYQFSKEKPFQYSYYYYLDSSQHVNSSLFWVQTVEKTSSTTGISSNQTLQGGGASNNTSACGRNGPDYAVASHIGGGISGVTAGFCCVTA